MLLYPILALIVGLVVLLWSADRFVYGAASIAHNFGLPHMIIGLTIVALGTSAPEIVVSIKAALNNNMPLALGNALGSNIANIGLVLGVTALVAKLPVLVSMLKQEGVMLFVATGLIAWQMRDLHLSRMEGLVLIVGLLIFLIWTITTALTPTKDVEQTTDNDTIEHDFDDDIPVGIPTWKALMWFTIGLVALIASAQMLIYGATTIATKFGVSELIIGATVLAIGTSLPELAASLTSALKGHTDIAIGNVVGSNLFNILAVIGAASIVSPASFDASALSLHMSMVAVTTGLLLLAALWAVWKKKSLHYGFSICALGLYGAYMYLML